MFSNSSSIREIEGAFQTLLNAKNQKKGNIIEAAQHPIIVNLVSKDGKDEYAGQIWGCYFRYDSWNQTNSRRMIME